MIDRLKKIGLFSIIQVCIQFLGALSGIILVRYLDKTDYAYYTIANNFQNIVSTIADTGISIALMSIGGQLWKDKVAFNSLATSVLSVRKKMAILSLTAVLPFFVYILYRNHAPVWLIIVLVCILTITFIVSLNKGIYTIVLRLYSYQDVFQWSEFIQVTLRLILVFGIAYTLGFNTWIACAIVFITFWIQNSYMKYKLHEKEFHLSKGEIQQEYVQKTYDLIKHNLPNILFMLFQGQLYILIITFFGNADSIAEIGALSRIGMMLTLFNAVLINYFVPSFAKVMYPKKILQYFVLIVGFVGILSLSLIGLVALFPDQLLWILGDQYKGLEPELVLLVSSMMFTNLINIIWRLSASRGWIVHSWVKIPFSIVVQIGLIFLISVQTTRGVILFNLYSGIPILLVHLALFYFGFKKYKQTYVA